MRAVRSLRAAPWGRIGAGALAGLVAALAMSLVTVLLRLLAGAPLPVELVTDRILPLVPVESFLELTNRLGGFVRAKQIGYTSSLLQGIAVGMVLGALFAVVRRPLVVVGAVLGLTWLVMAAALWPELDGNYRGLAATPARLVSLGALALAFAVFLAVLAGVHRLVVRPRREGVSETEGPAPGPVMRRGAFIAAGAAGALAVATGGAAASLYRRGAFGYDGLSYVPRDAITPLTPNDRFYVVTKNLIDPRVSRSAWSLRIDGAVERPMTLSYADLEAMRSVEQETTLECISNSVGGGLMSNARWTGVPLPRLLERAGVRPDAVQLFAHAADGYTKELRLDRAMREVTLVAYGMNGAPLPDRHGYPARIIVPGNYGEGNVKWVTRLELVTDEHEGFYTRQGWEDGRVRTMSRIDWPRRGASLPSAPAVEVTGVAFAGDRGIRAVEVSTDGGRRFRPAEIGYSSPLTWSLWRFAWRQPAAGAHELVVRAIDGDGDPQDPTMRSIQPSGSGGLHRVGVTVTT